MNAISVKEILERPLAGSLPLLEEPGAYAVMLESLFLRLVLIYGRVRSSYLVDQIKLEGSKATINRKEYVINELQYEIRLFQGIRYGYGPAYESAIINAWGELLIEKHGEDPTLDFIAALAISRAGRKRV